MAWEWLEKYLKGSKVQPNAPDVIAGAATEPRQGLFGTGGFTYRGSSRTGGGHERDRDCHSLHHCRAACLQSAGSFMGCP